MTQGYIHRLLSLADKLENRSCFLFGPRQTGKSTLIRNQLPEAKVYNLLDSNVYLALSTRPALLREELTQTDRLVVIDEIQKAPQLLDEVHLLIEERGLRFLLTGSSARKLRRAGVNLLGGRAKTLTLHPFCSSELARFDLLRALNWGLLPSIYLSPEPEEEIKAYAGTYLREEIAAEGLTRNIPAFGRFLEVAALCNAAMLNFSKVASDAQVPRTTVQEYFSILEDTLIAHRLPAWNKSRKRKPITTDKFYFFDPGVVRFLRREGEIQQGSPAFGAAFETFLFHELNCFAAYGEGSQLGYWRSTSNFEVDFVIDDLVAIEVKGKSLPSPRDYRGLLALKQEKAFKYHVVVCMAERPRTVDGVEILPWRQFLQRLWAGDFV